MTAEDTKNILIVDDEPLLREVLEYEVSDMGYTPLVAGNGTEAIEIVKKNPIHAVISDVRMPGGDGVQLLDAIKNYNVETPTVIMMSGYSDLTLEDAYDKGAIAMFSKPLDLAALRELLHESLTPRDVRWARREDLTTVKGVVDLSFEGDCAPCQAQIVNLGRGGMFVKLSDAKTTRFNSAVKFKVTFNSDTKMSIEGTGIVRWIRINGKGALPHGMGIEFKFLSETCRKSVVSLIENSGVRSYIPKS